MFDMNGKVNVKRVHIYDIKNIFTVANILNRCGKDMADKYGLHHWDNAMMKNYIIVVLCLLKNHIYLVYDEQKAIATFQLKKLGEILFFEKLAVTPEASGKGYGSCCMKLIESKAAKLGCEKIQMEVYDQSEHAIKFYLNKGYSQVGKTSTLKYADVVMEKTVGK